jgi:hypothetical protein
MTDYFQKFRKKKENYLGANHRRLIRAKRRLRTTKQNNNRYAIFSDNQLGTARKILARDSINGKLPPQ